MIFQNPSAFLLFIPLAVFYHFLHGKKRDFISHPFSFKTGRLLLPGTCSILYLCSVVFIITALSSPSVRQEKTKYITPGENYFFILDVSPSMAINDIDSKRRIDAAKEIITGFRKTRSNDYPGLILFSDEAVLSVPPSPDINWFDNAVSEADVVYPDRGTAVGDAAALAVFYLRKSSAENKLAVLISDGISNTGTVSPETAAQAAYESGIKIYTVSVGPDSVDNDILKMIASETGAMYFDGESINELEYAFSFIGSMEGRERISEKVIDFVNYRDIFVKAALFCLFTAVFIKIFILKEIIL